MAPVQTNPVPAKNGNTIYLIRHGEKPKNKDDVKAEAIEEQNMDVKTKDADGNLAKLTINDLNIDGWTRAKQLPEALTKLNITPSYIIAQIPDETEKSNRPEETVSWLKQSIPAANYDNTRTTNEFKEVAADALKYVVEGDVLICWEHARLINIAQAIGVTNPIPYPDDRFDLIWTLSPDAHGKYTAISTITSEQISPLDDDFTGNKWTSIDAGWEEIDSDKNPVGKFEYRDTDPYDDSNSAWIQSEAKKKDWRPKERWSREKGSDYTVQWTRYKWNKDSEDWEEKKD